MNSDYEKMEAGKELDIAIAELMGATWRNVTPKGRTRELSFTSERALLRIENGKVHLYGGPTEKDQRLPFYSSSIEAAHTVEDRIEELGLQVPYIQALAAVVGCRLLANVKEYWLMLRATPEQRCRAALLAATEKG